MPTIYIDDEPFEVAEGQNLLAACLSLGFDIPYFCWHPAMGSVGACRQCAVKRFRDEHDTEGEIVMACLTPADEGTRISIDDPDARAFRAAVSEWLMANHPHDCPVCDEGGECHLQDMTVMAGHVHRRYKYPKRTFRNQDLGPFLNHEMNRCIQCYRCVRFYNDYAGGEDLAALGSRDYVYFGRHSDGKLESEFSGNLVEVCPTGVFTDKTQKKHYTRKWDLQTAPSVCVHCGLGCNTLPGERYGVLRRIRNRYNHNVNGYFLCDRGRFGYEFVNSGHRVRRVTVQSASGVGLLSTDLEPEGDTIAPHQAVGVIAEGIRAARARGERVIGIGSPRASLEANFALRKLVGEDDFFAGMEARERHLVDLVRTVLVEGPSRGCSLRDLEKADAMLILGEDVTNTAPMLDYSLRQWLRRRPNAEAMSLRIPEWNDAALGEIVHEEPSDLHLATVLETKLDKIAAQTYHAAPPDLARLGFAVAHLLDPRAPAVADLPKDIEDHARSIAAAFEKARRPIVISGTSSGSKELLAAAANVAWSLRARRETAELCLVVPESNSVGLSLLGGRPLEEAFALAEQPGIGVVIILENDLYRRGLESTVDRFLRSCRHAVVLDHSESKTSWAAELVLPAATFAESTGTLVNNEGRAQRHYQVMKPDDDIRESRAWLAAIAQTLADGKVADGEAEGWSVDSLSRELAEEFPVFRPVVGMAPTADFRMVGMKVPRQSHRRSGRTAAHAQDTVFEPAPPEDGEAPLAFSMEGYEGQPPPQLVSRYWAPGWNSDQAVNRYVEVPGGRLHGGDVGVRLIEPHDVGSVSHFMEVPPAFGPEGKGMLVVAVHHIFGSEELSMRSSSVAGCAPAPYVGVSPEWASALEVKEGDFISLRAADVTRFLPARFIASLPSQVAALPVGLSGLEGLHPPFWAEIVGAGEIEGARTAEEEAADV